jgi:hypothetical protein
VGAASSLAKPFVPGALAPAIDYLKDRIQIDGPFNQNNGFDTIARSRGYSDQAFMTKGFQSAVGNGDISSQAIKTVYLPEINAALIPTDNSDISAVPTRFSKQIDLNTDPSGSVCGFYLPKMMGYSGGILSTGDVNGSHLVVWLSWSNSNL